MNLSPLELGMVVLAALLAFSPRPARTEGVPPATERDAELIDQLAGEKRESDKRAAEAWARAYRAASSIIGR